MVSVVLILTPLLGGKATFLEIENQQKGRTPSLWHAGVNLSSMVFAFVCACVRAGEWR